MTPWSLFLAIVAFFGVQMALVGAAFYVYSRMRTQQDIQGQAQQNWSAKLELAVKTADTALSRADTIEIQHYRSLRVLFDEQAALIGALNGKVKALEAELALCNRKLASEERMSRRAVAKAAKASQEEDDDDLGEGLIPKLPKNPTMEDLRKAGLPVLPMSPKQAPAQPAPSSFGKVAR